MGTSIRYLENTYAHLQADLPKLREIALGIQANSEK